MYFGNEIKTAKIYFSIIFIKKPTMNNNLIVRQFVRTVAPRTTVNVESHVQAQVVFRLWRHDAFLRDVTNLRLVVAAVAHVGKLVGGSLELKTNKVLFFFSFSSLILELKTVMKYIPLNNTNIFFCTFLL